MKKKAPEGETQPTTEVDLFISTEKIMVLNTELKVSSFSLSLGLHHALTIFLLLFFSLSLSPSSVYPTGAD